MRRKTRTGSIAVVLALAAGLLPAGSAFAGSAGKRNTAIALGAAALYGVAARKPALAGLAAGGAVYSYMRSREDLRKERRRRRVHRHHAGCGHRPYGWSRGKKTGWRGGHRPPGLAKR